MRVYLALIALISGLFLPSISAATELQFSQCLMPNTSNTQLILGTPLAAERLGNKSKIQVGVVPFYFANSKLPSSVNVNTSTYRAAVEHIQNLSNQIVEISLKFSPVIKTSLLAQDFGSQDTYKYVTKIIQDADKSVDFSNVDVLVLENKSEGVKAANVAEFLLFSGGPNSNLPILKTAEGLISNVVVLSENYFPELIAHELLHAFGLVDLYPTDTDLRGFSMMSSSSRGSGARLLNYEKAVLGWFPAENIQCETLQTFSSSALDKNLISFDDIRKDHLFILKSGDEEALIFEVQNGNLLIYHLDNATSPPITLLERKSGGLTSNLLSLSYERNVSEVFIPTSTTTQFKTGKIPNFNVLYLKKDRNRADLVFVADSQLDSQEFGDIVKESKVNLDAVLGLAKKSTKAKKSILCVKGNLTKKISGTNPKCPKGYKKK